MEPMSQKSHDQDVQDNNVKLCLLASVKSDDLYSFASVNTRGERRVATKGKCLEILCFRHFAKHCTFEVQSDLSRKKEVLHGINVSVMLEL